MSDFTDRMTGGAGPKPYQPIPGPHYELITGPIATGFHELMRRVGYDPDNPGDVFFALDDLLKAHRDDWFVRYKVWHTICYLLEEEDGWTRDDFIRDLPVVD